VVYLPPGGGGEQCMTLLHRSLVDNQRCSTVLPGTRRVILVAPHLNREWLMEQGWTPQGPVYYRDLAPGSGIQVGDYRLIQPASTS